MLKSARSSRCAHMCGSVVESARLKQNACAVVTYRIEWRFLPPQRSLVVLWIVSHFVAVLCDRRHRTGTSTTSQLMKAGGLCVAHLFTRSRCTKDCFKQNYNGQHRECWQAGIKCLPCASHSPARERPKQRRDRDCASVTCCWSFIDFMRGPSCCSLMVTIRYGVIQPEAQI